MFLWLRICLKDISYRDLTDYNNKKRRCRKETARLFVELG